MLGCAQPEGEQGLNVARLVGLLAGLPDEVPAMTINRFCSSGLQATSIVADRIAVGGIDAGIAGGRRVDVDDPDGRRAGRRSTRALVDSVPDAYIPMGNTAENVARQFKVSRERAGRVRPAQPPEGGGRLDRGAHSPPRWCRSKTRVFEDGAWQRRHRRQGRGAARRHHRWRSWRR